MKTWSLLFLILLSGCAALPAHQDLGAVRTPRLDRESQRCEPVLGADREPARSVVAVHADRVVGLVDLRQIPVLHDDHGAACGFPTVGSLFFSTPLLVPEHQE